MPIRRILAAAVGGALCASSCFQSAEAPDVTGARAPGMHVEDESTPSPPDGDATRAGTRDVCLTVCKSGPVARAAFCRLLFDPVLQESCMKRVWGSLAACTMWCYWEF
jgi:hypothetical protein